MMEQKMTVCQAPDARYPNGYTNGSMLQMARIFSGSAAAQEAGKSAIAATFAKELMNRGRLGAQFYFQHGVNDAKEFWRTIAFYLARPRPFILEEIAKFLAQVPPGQTWKL
jgi:hypothetical protein